MHKVAFFSGLLLLTACSSAPPRPTVPTLTPEGAAQLLHYNTRAENWMIHIKKQDPSCGYTLDLPSQISHPTEIDLDHIVTCGGRPSPREFDASVSFEYDKEKQQWVITRFSS